MKSYTKKQSNNKRQFERLDAKFQVSLFYGNIVYPGMVTNLSENGMYISTRRKLPVDAMLVTFLMIGDEPLKLPIQIMRSSNSVDMNDSPDNGLGVQLITCSENYLDFFDKYRASTQQLKLAI